MRQHICLALLVLWGTSLGFSQQGRGTIAGTVTDPTGAAVPAATVFVRNVNTNIDFPTSTNEAGYYIVPGVAVGEYAVTVEKPGFKKVVRTGIRVEVGQHASMAFQLEVGDATTTVTVAGEAPLVEAGTATLGKVVENRRINDLPLNGRNTLALVLLTPGVKSPAGPTASGFSDRGILLSSVSINGGPSANNSLVLDGGTNNAAYTYDLNVNPSVEAVEEFRVQSGVLSADVGFTLGGNINMVTKSGTNQAHGTVYEFLRNNVLDARNTFARSVSPFRYNQYGGSLGGPVRLPKLYNGKDRTFFFFNYEAWRFRRYDSNTLTVATEAERNGDFSALKDARGTAIPIYDPATTTANPNGSGYVRTVFPNNIIPTDRLDPVSVNMLQFYPLPNTTPSNVYTHSNNWIGQVDGTRRMNQQTVKADHRLTDNNNLTVRYTHYYHYDDNGASGTAAGTLPDPEVRLRIDHYRNHNAVISDTHTFTPSKLNEFRLSVARLRFPFTAYSYDHNWIEKLGLSSLIPNFTLPSVSNGMPSFANLSIGLRGALTYQLVDMATLILGNHTLKIGTDLRLNYMNNRQSNTPSGSFFFGATTNPQATAGTGSTFAGFMAGAVTSASIDKFQGTSQAAYSTSYFVQDDWKLTRRLTLNLGLRYDYQQPPVERYHRQSNFSPFETVASNGLLGKMVYASADYGRSPYKPNKLNFAPRIGFAYDPFGHGQTVLRGGYAILYDWLFANRQGSGNGFSSYTTSYSPAISSYPAFYFQDGPPSAPIEPLGRSLGEGGYLGQSPTWTVGNEKTPYAQLWTLSLQQQMPGKWLVDVTYTANKGTHLTAGSLNYNSLDPKYYSLGNSLTDAVANPYAGMFSGSLASSTITRKQALLPYPYYRSITMTASLGSSIYHALLLSVERRFASGMTFMMSYTNAKLISDSVYSYMGWTTSSGGANLTGYQNGMYNRKDERSVDPTDISQRAVFSGVFDMPFGRNHRWNPGNPVVRKLVSGWQLDVIATVQTGNPVYVRGASNNLADRPNSSGVSAHLDNRTRYKWFDTAQFVNPSNYTFGNVGRTLPDVRNPGTINFDVSAIKNTTITEKLKVEFRAEAFNIMNHVNLGNPNATFSPGSNGYNASSTFGTITSARDPRLMQVGMKVVF